MQVKNKEETANCPKYGIDSVLSSKYLIEDEAFFIGDES